MNNIKSPVAPLVIEIKPSKMLSGEIGLFAARPLKKDFVIAEAEKLEEKLVPWAVFKTIDKITREKILQYCLQTEDGFYVPRDLNYMTVPWNMNHSCSYNVGFDKDGNFVVTRAVSKGEELTWDYGMGISDPKFRLTCRCGSKNCRKIITGNDWKDPVFLGKNKKYFLRELLENAKSADR